MTRNKYVRVSLHGMLRIIRVNTLRIVNNGGFLVERLKPCMYLSVVIEILVKVLHATILQDEF